MSTPIRLYLGQPAITDTTLFTVSVNTVLTKQVLVSNTTGALATLTMFLVPAGAVAATANEIIPTVSYGGNSVTIYDLIQVMAVGDALVAHQGTASALTVLISGIAL